MTEQQILSGPRPSGVHRPAMPGPAQVADWPRQAVIGVRRHRQEMLILAGTLGFVAVVLLLCLRVLL